MSGIDESNVPAVCGYASEVVADVRLWPHCDGEEHLQMLIRKSLSTSPRFSRSWPTCHVTGRSLSLQFRRGKADTYLGYFECPHCQ